MSRGRRESLKPRAGGGPGWAAEPGGRVHTLDYALFLTYMAVVLGIGYHFYRKNVTAEDFYVGGRKVAPTHVGLSIVATDVGGGFSIGLGGLGFAIGLAGSWLLFTGLVGAWLSAVLVLPRIKRLDARHGMMTYPDFLRLRYGERVALLAAVISGIGYLGFTGAQVLAGAKLAVGTILPRAPWGLDPLQFALCVIAVVVIAYTVMGGIKAVIFTDTVQWIVLLTGLGGGGLLEHGGRRRRFTVGRLAARGAAMGPGCHRVRNRGIGGGLRHGFPVCVRKEGVENATEQLSESVHWIPPVRDDCDCRETRVRTKRRLAGGKTDPDTDPEQRLPSSGKRRTAPGETPQGRSSRT